MQTPLDLSTAEREWIDGRWSWLIQHFGGSIPRKNRIIQSAQEVLPHSGTLSTDHVQRCADLLCQRLGLDKFETRVVVRHILSPKEQADLDDELDAINEEGRHGIWLEPDDLDSPYEAAAILTKQIAQAHLSHSAETVAAGMDGVMLGELYTVFLGGGVLLANIAVVDVSWSGSLVHHWRIQRHAYLTIPMIGYALARLAHHRHEKNPDWTGRLKPDVKTRVKRMLKHFESEPPANTPLSAPLPFPPLEEDLPQTPATYLAPAVLEQDLIQGSQRETAIYCVACGYNLANLGPGLCPECGVKFHPEDMNTVSNDPPYTEPFPIKALIWINKSIFLFLLLFVLIVGIVLGIATILGIKL